MLLSMEHFDGPNLAGQVREFVGDILRRYPAFQMETLAAALNNLPAEPQPERAMEILMGQSFNSLPWPEGAAALKKKEQDKCFENTVCCLLLWYNETRGISFKDINNSLRMSLWKSAAERHKSEAQQLRAPMNNRDPAAAALPCSLLDKQVLDAKKQAYAAHETAERAKARTREPKDRLNDVEMQLDAGRI